MTEDTPPAKRRYYPRNPESDRKYRERNRTRILAAQRVRSRRTWLRHHGPRVQEWIGEALLAQQGMCYLCGGPLGEQKAIDHDHTCCPPAFSCAACRRGLACQRCNRLIGQVGDDPALLRRIADALESALGPARERIARKAFQLSLLTEEEGP